MNDKQGGDEERKDEPQEPEPTRLPDGTFVVTLRENLEVRIPPGMTGIQFVFSGWYDCGCSQRDGMRLMELIDAPDFLRSAALDPVPLAEGEFENFRGVREKARTDWVDSILRNPHCSPDVIAEIVKRMGLDQEGDPVGDRLSAAIAGLHPLSSTQGLRMALVCSDRISEESLRMLARERRADFLYLFLCDLGDFVGPSRKKIPRPEFFRYVFDEASNRPEIEKTNLCIGLLRCTVAPNDVRLDAAHFVTDEARLTSLVGQQIKAFELELMSLLRESLPDGVNKLLRQQLVRMRKIGFS